MQTLPALYQAMDEVVQAQREQLAIPRRYDADMKEIWALQPRFLQRGGHRPYRLLEHPRFRAGYDFLLLRCESGEVDAELGEWWTRFQDAGERRARRDAAGRRRAEEAPAQAAPQAGRGDGAAAAAMPLREGDTDN